MLIITCETDSTQCEYLSGIVSEDHNIDIVVEVDGMESEIKMVNVVRQDVSAQKKIIETEYNIGPILSELLLADVKRFALEQYEALQAEKSRIDLDEMKAEVQLDSVREDAV